MGTNRTMVDSKVLEREGIVMAAGRGRPRKKRFYDYDLETMPLQHHKDILYYLRNGLVRLLGCMWKKWYRIYRDRKNGCYVVEYK